jgi:hypothetical protein
VADGVLEPLLGLLEVVVPQRDAAEVVIRDGSSPVLFSDSLEFRLRAVVVGAAVEGNAEREFSARVARLQRQEFFEISLMSIRLTPSPGCRLTTASRCRSNASCRSRRRPAG